MSAEAAKKEIASILPLVAQDLKDTDIGPEARAMRLASKYEMTEEGLAPLIVRARKEPAAFDACTVLLNDLTQSGQPIPDNLALMARDVMTGAQKRPAQRGPDGMTKWGRDGVILTCLGIAQEHGLPLYAHGNATGPTACTVVAAALEEHGVVLTPDAVESVWQKHQGGKK